MALQNSSAGSSLLVQKKEKLLRTDGSFYLILSKMGVIEYSQMHGICYIYSLVLLGGSIQVRNVFSFIFSFLTELVRRNDIKNSLC